MTFKGYEKMQSIVPVVSETKRRDRNSHTYDIYIYINSHAQTSIYHEAKFVCKAYVLSCQIKNKPQIRIPHPRLPFGQTL